MKDDRSAVVRLPALLSPGRGAQRGPEPRDTSRCSYRILVVGDNKDGADSLAMMLRIMGPVGPLFIRPLVFTNFDHTLIQAA